MKNFDYQRSLSDISANDPQYEGDSQSHRVKLIHRCLSRYGISRRILDVGAADGSVLAALAKRHELYALDCNPALLERCRERGYQRTLVSDAFVNEWHSWQPSFDAIVCAECLEHGVDTNHLLWECKKALKHGGDLILSVPNIRTPIGVLMLICGMVPMMGSGYRTGHVRDFTLASIKEALVSNGFRIQGAWGCGFAVGPNKMILPWLAERFPSWASQIVVHATKK